jgi:hypothetical protein
MMATGKRRESDSYTSNYNIEKIIKQMANNSRGHGNRKGFQHYRG